MRKRVLEQLIRREHAVQKNRAEGNDIESQTDPNLPRTSTSGSHGKSPRGHIGADVRALDQDIADDDTSPETLRRDFAKLLDDCEDYLEALLKGDPDMMRDLLRQVFVDRDGKGMDASDQGAHHLVNDDDELVKSMLLKHCSSECFSLFCVARDWTLHLYSQIRFRS